jgi:hypothetical protein
LSMVPQQALAGIYQLVPVQLAGYVLVVEPVEDRTSLWTGRRVAAAQQSFISSLHLPVGELVAQLYGRVARYGGEDTNRVESGSEPRGDHKSPHGTSRIGPGAPCACSRPDL